MRRKRFGSRVGFGLAETCGFDWECGSQVADRRRCRSSAEPFARGLAAASCWGFPDRHVACPAVDACSSCLDVAAAVAAAAVVVVAAAAGPGCRHQSRPPDESRRRKGGAHASARRS